MRQAADPILFKLTFPLIFRPNTKVQEMWDRFVFATVGFLALYLPYSFSFSCKFTVFMAYYPIVYVLIFLLDLALKVSTGVRTSEGYLIQLTTILQYQILRPAFIVDFISTLPLFLLSYLLETTSMRSIFQLNQLLKIYRIETYLQDWSTAKSEFQICIRRLFKYFVYYTYFIYLYTCFFYAYLCSNNLECIVKVLEQYQEDALMGSTSKIDLLVCAMYNMCTFFVGDISAWDYLAERASFICFIISRLISFLLQTYILSSLIQVAAINAESTMKQEEKFSALCMEIEKRKSSRFLKKRILNLIKVYNRLKMSSVNYISDLPPAFRVKTKMSMYLTQIIHHPLFKEGARSFITRMASQCHTCMVPRNEVVCKKDHSSQEMFFVKRGVLVTYEDDAIVERRLWPGSDIGIIEVCLDIPYMRTVITETDCELIMVKKTGFLLALRNVLGMQAYYKVTKIFKDVVDEISPRDNRRDKNIKVLDFHRKIKADMRLITDSFTKKVEDRKRSFAVRKINRSRIYKYIKLVQDRITFTPQSRELWLWEIGKWIMVVVNCIFYPIQPLLLGCLFDGIKVFSHILTVYGFVDIIVRAHCPYYHPKLKIVITNHKLTVLHYYKHNFFFDLVSVFPFEVYPQGNQLVALLLSYNRFIQVYRLIMGLRAMEMHFPKHKYLWHVFRYIILVCFTAHALSGVFLLSSCTVGKDVNLTDPKWSSCLRCRNQTWTENIFIYFHTKPLTFPINSFKAYLYALYLGTNIMTSNSMPYLFPYNKHEQILSLVFLLIGLFLFFYMAANVVNSGLHFNMALHEYKRQVNKILYFLYAANFHKATLQVIKCQLTSIWEYNRNVSLADSTYQIHSVLKEDYFFSLFLKGLVKNPVLKDAPYYFYEKLFMRFRVTTFVRNCTVIQAGDVVKYMFIVVQGMAQVFDREENYLGTIGPGSIFGAVGPVRYSLQTFTIVATSFMEIIEVLTAHIHRTALSKLPELAKHFTEDNKPNLIVELPDDTVVNKTKVRPYRYTRTCCRKKASERSNNDTGFPQVQEVSKKCKTISKLWPEVHVLLCFLSCSLVMYSTVTSDKEVTYLFTFFYILDALKCINIFIILYSLGDKKCKAFTVFPRIKGVVFDILMNFPLDLICILSFHRVSHWAILLRVNRFLGYFYMINYWVVRCRRDLKSPLPNLSHLRCAYILVLAGATYLLIVPGIFYLFARADTDQASFQEYGNVTDADLRMSSYLMCVAHVVGLRPYTSRSVSEDRPSPKFWLFVLFIILHAILRPMIFTVYFTFFYACVFRSRFIFPKFRERFTKLMTFLDDQNTAMCLRLSTRKLMEYYWYNFQGSHRAKLANSLPVHLYSAVKNHVVGAHVFYNEIFKDCDPDFVRQLVGCMKLIFLDADMRIVTSGTRDCTMYFIQSGTVIVNDTSIDLTVDVLSDWDSFGWQQGISNEGHYYDYITYSQCTVCSLNFSSWKYLIKFYPDSFKKMQTNTREQVIKQNLVYQFNTENAMSNQYHGRFGQNSQ